jgi:hypothetical protein
MNGLSHRLDKIVAQAEKNGKAQGRQQAVMIALTAVPAVATVAYTATTIYATRATVSAQRASNGSQVRVEYVRGSGGRARERSGAWERTRRVALLFAGRGGR